MKDKILPNKLKIYIILKLNKNLKMNLISMMVYFQDKEDLERLENVLVNQINLKINLKKK